MNIAHIWKDDYPWDVRVEKISRALIDDGHQVHLICKNNCKQKIRDEIDGMQIHRLYPFPTSFLNNVLSIVAFFNPIWIHRIYQVVKREKIDILLVRDLPLAISALWVSKIFKIPVVFDMAENYPSMWKEHVDKRGMKFFNHLTKNPILATFMENYVLKRVDHVIVVVEESRDRITKKGISKDNVSIVSNTPDLALFDIPKSITDDPYPDKFKIVYVGSINGGRGLHTVIEAIPVVNENISNVHLIIVGDGEYLEELKKLAKELDVSEYISFLGWIDPEFVPSYIHNSDICIVPHVVTEFINTTIPNKIFDYMACEKPVIVSNAAPLQRIVEEADCGMVFRSGDNEDFAEKVLHLKDDTVRRKKGMAGLEAVKTKYNWEYDRRILRNVFNSRFHSSSAESI